MGSPKYMMVTLAACDAAYVQEALGHVDTLAQALRAEAGALATRYGVLATGSEAGQLVLFQTYDELNGIDRAFGVYAGLDAYKALMASGRLSVTLRNIVRLEDVTLSNPSTDKPAYGVVTRWSAKSSKTDELRQVLPILEDAGAMVLRYGTLATGANAGKTLMVVGYPSMDAIEKTYDGLSRSAVYRQFLIDVDVDMRNIIRVVG